MGVRGCGGGVRKERVMPQGEGSGGVGGYWCVRPGAVRGEGRDEVERGG